MITLVYTVYLKKIHTHILDNQKSISFAQETGLSKWKQVEWVMVAKRRPASGNAEERHNKYVCERWEEVLVCFWQGPRVTFVWRIHQCSGARVWAFALQAQNPDQQEIRVWKAPLFRGLRTWVLPISSSLGFLDSCLTISLSSQHLFHFGNDKWIVILLPWDCHRSWGFP